MSRVRRPFAPIAPIAPIASFALLVLALGPSLGLAQSTPPPPAAGGSLSLSWNQCAPIVANRASFAGPMELYASVTNHALPHQAYQVWLLMGDQDRALPDAWRFDAAGCNAGRAAISAVPPAALSKACPPFVPTTIPQLEIAQFQFAPAALGYATTLGCAALAVAYPNEGAGSPNVDPAQRYFLGRYLFDHTLSSPGPTPADGSTCGGLERPMCIVAIPGKATWLDLAFNEYSFRDTPAAWAVVNGGPYGCTGSIEPTPARRATWGAIKAQYKR